MKYSSHMHEQGSITALGAYSMIALAMMAVLVLELGCAYTTRTTLASVLGIARESTLTPGFEMQAKNDEDPGALIAARIARAMSLNGRTGTLTVLVREESSEEIAAALPGASASDVARLRDVVYQASFQCEQANTIAPADWLAGLIVSTDTCASLCPYSSQAIYKPWENGSADASQPGKLYIYCIQIEDSTLAESSYYLQAHQQRATSTASLTAAFVSARDASYEKLAAELER